MVKMYERLVFNNKQRDKYLRKVEKIHQKLEKKYGNVKKSTVWIFLGGGYLASTKFEIERGDA